MLTNLNGTLLPTDQACLPVNDGAALYGDSLFETMRVVNGRICWRDDHLDRLQRAANLLKMPCDRERLHQELQRTLDALQPGVYRLRLTLSRGPMTGPVLPNGDAMHWVITASPVAPMDDGQRALGYACVLAPNHRVNPLSHLPQMKRGNYADCLYAKAHARRQNADEALFIDDGGFLLEGATTNLFLVEGNRLLTPPLGNLVLNGVMRQQILRRAASLKLETKEERIAEERLYKADGAFLTNAVIGVVPVKSLEDEPVPQTDTWRKIQQAISFG